MLAKNTSEYLLRKQWKDILEHVGNIAIVGVRTEPFFKSYGRAQKLIEYGLKVILVLPDRQSFLGASCYASLNEVPASVDIVQVYPGPGVDLTALARDAIEKGAVAFWVEDDEAPEAARKILSRSQVYLIEYESLEAEYRKHFVPGPIAPPPLRSGFAGKVSACMTRFPITVKRNECLEDALSKMKRGHFRHLPVVGDNNRLIGMLSDRDLRLIHPSFAFVPHESGIEQLRSMTVEQAAIFNPIAVLHDARLVEAAELMLRWEVGALPVVAGDAHVVGIITYSDLLRAFVASGKEAANKGAKSDVRLAANG